MNITIIGAGLSGLATAYYLQHLDFNITIIESRDRPGGRIFTKKEHPQLPLELGATWFGLHHLHLKALLDELNISYFKQYQKGQSALVYNSMMPAHFFEAEESENSSYRIAEGSVSLIDKLLDKLSVAIHYQQKVTRITNTGKQLKITTNKGQYTADKVILTTPPQLAISQIEFVPQLPALLSEQMQATHTWMSHAIKLVIRYKDAFWREKGKSGMLISQIGAVTEIYDHSHPNEPQFALMGFINERLKAYDPAERKKQVLEYLSTHLGEEANNYLTYEEKIWPLDKNTSIPQPANLTIRPSYGNPLFEDSYMENKLFISGTETASCYGGYMEGAVFSARQLAEKLNGFK